MRGPEKQAIVCRTENGIVEKVEELSFVKDKHPVLGWPFVRGVFTLVDSLAKGMKALTYSASLLPEDQQEEPGKFDLWIEKKLGRLEKLFPADTLATVTLSVDKLDATVEVTIPYNQRLLRAEVKDPDLTAAIDTAVDVLEGQIVRYKKRLRNKVRQQEGDFLAEYQSIPIAEEELDEEPLYKIERVKQIDVKPMDAEEAVMEMEMIGHSFFVFRNGETDEINVVYKRKNGSYGLIEPEA